MSDLHFHLMVRSREGLLYEGEVLALTSENSQGKFDILAEHTNFITLIKSFLKIKELTGQVKDIPIDNGLLRTYQNKVEVYLGIEGLGRDMNKKT